MLYCNILALVSCMIISAPFCQAMNGEKEKFKEIIVVKNYITDKCNKLPECIYQERINEYIHNYEPIPGQKLSLKKHEEYAKQFNTSVLLGGKYSYAILQHDTKELEKLATPKSYLQALCSVVCFLYTEILAKDKFEAGPKYWSLILKDSEGVWKKFFIDGYEKVTNKNKKYINSITTSHLTDIHLRSHHCITTDITPETVEPFGLPHNDNQILLIPNHDKKWLFIKTGKSKETGWTETTTKGLVNGLFSRVCKELSLEPDEKDHKEHLLPSIQKRVLKLLPDAEKNQTTYFHQIIDLLRKTKDQNIGEEKKMNITKLYYELQSQFDHHDIRLGNEIILEEAKIESSSLLYALLEQNENNFFHTEQSTNYFKIIIPFAELQRCIFLHNHGMEKEYPMQTIRNKATQCIETLQKNNDFSKINKNVTQYLLNIVNILTYSLKSDKCDIHLSAKPLFEKDKHTSILQALEKEIDEAHKEKTQNPETNPTSSLVLPTDPREEQE